MKVAMVKHSPNGKIFWFEIPEEYEDRIRVGSRVACETAYGQKYGIVIGADLNADDVKELMIAGGATFPLKKIGSITEMIRIDDIKIPSHFASTTPKDEKLAKRFLEMYHTGKFDTNIAVNARGYLTDGYSAYLVARYMGQDFLKAFVTKN